METVPGTLAVFNLLEHRRAGMDAESLQKTSALPRSCCMKACLLVCVTFLFIAVGGLTVGGILFTINTRSLIKDEIQKPPCNTHGDSRPPVYNMHSAFLRPTSSDLSNGTMKWANVRHGELTSIGDYFSFNKQQGALRPTREGDYLLYLHLHLSCTSRCNAGSLTVRLGDQLACRVELPERSETPVSVKCCVRARMDGTRALVAQMSVPRGLEDWRLELNESKLGMVLLDGCGALGGLARPSQWQRGVTEMNTEAVCQALWGLSLDP